MSADLARDAGCDYSTLYRAFLRAGLSIRKRLPPTATAKFYNTRFPEADVYALVQSAAAKINESMNQFITTAAIERAKSLGAQSLATPASS